MNIRVAGDERPIEPIEFAVVTVGVVITVLRPLNFITHREHRQTKRVHCYGEEILHRAVSESLNCRIIGGTRLLLEVTCHTPSPQLLPR